MDRGDRTVSVPQPGDGTTCCHLRWRADWPLGRHDRLLAHEHPVVHRLAIGSGRRRIRYLAPWSVAKELNERQLRLTVGRAGMAEYWVDRSLPLEDKELFLCGDVLDTQVVDLADRRLARVSDVLLADCPTTRSRSPPWTSASALFYAAWLGKG